MKVERNRLFILSTLFFIGGYTFFRGITGETPVRTWGVFLVNFLYFTGIASAGIVFSAITYVTNSTWHGGMRDVAEKMASILPFSFLIFPLLILGRDEIFSVFEYSPHIRKEWLNFEFLFLRDWTSLGIFIIIGFYFIYLSQKLNRLKEGTEDFKKIKRGVNILSPVILIAYALLFTLLSFDLVMALTPGWYSTLFGAYIFISSFLTGLAWIIILSVMTLKNSSSLNITSRQFYDIGKLLLGFTLISGDLFWSQFLVIWYGNLPDETTFIINRIFTPHWYILSWTVLFICFIFPFLLLLSKKVKEVPAILFLIAVIIAGGMWTEKFLLIIPSLWKGEIIPIGASEILITVGFLSLFLLSFIYIGNYKPQRSQR